MRSTTRLVRPATSQDHEAVRSIFTSTFALGRPVHVEGIAPYTDFSLDWYLQRGSDAVFVHIEEKDVTGYLLLCTDQDDFEDHQRRAALRYVSAVLRLAARGRLRGDARRFHLLRVRDGWELYRNGPMRPAAAHVHLNLLPGARASVAGRRLIDAADEAVARAGHDAWYAEINAPVGRRADALSRLGAEVIHRSENRTLTEFAGRAVERLTIVRRL